MRRSNQLMAFVSFMAICSVQTARAAAEPFQGSPVDDPQSVSSERPDLIAENEIVVTAQKRSERLQDVPMSITAASAEQLQSRGIVSTDDLAKLVPGFSFQRSNYGLPIYYIRGVGFSDTTLGVSPAVTVYVDQVPLPFSPMSRGAVLDLERVEVLKGPQGTLFGQNSTGGAINYIAAKPTDQLKAGVSLTVGRFDQVDAEAYIGGPISDTLSARVAIRREYQGDWQKGYVNGDTIGSKDFVNGRLILDWVPADKVRFELQASAWTDRSDTQQPQFISVTPAVLQSEGGRPPKFPVASFPPAPRNNRAASWDPGFDFRRDDRFYQLALRSELDLSDAITATSISSYSNLRTDLPQDFDATIFPAERTRIKGKISSFSQELRLAGEFGERIRWMIGGNYQDDTVKERFTFDPVSDSGSGIGPFFWDSYINRNDQFIETIGAFGSVDYKLSDTLTAQASVRYTKQNRSFEGCTADDGNGTLAAAFSFFYELIGQPLTVPPGECITASAATFTPLPIVTGTLNEDNVSWRGSLNWKPSSATLIYANVTKGYKAGSFPTLAGPFDNQYNPVPQESLMAYEAGAKFDLLDRKLTLESAAFYYVYRDKQLLGFEIIEPFGALPALVTIPKSRVFGAEVNVTAFPLSGLRLSLAGTYLNTKVQSDPQNPIGPFSSVASFVGQSFPHTPRWQGTVDAEYRFALNSNTEMFFGGTVNGRTQTKGTLFNGTGEIADLERQLVINGYALVDLRAGLEASDQSWRAEVWGRNVGDTFYSNASTHGGDYTYRFTGSPATFGVTLKYRFE